MDSPMKRYTAAAVLFLACCNGVAAKDIAISGEGGHSCGMYLESRRVVNETQDYMYVAWVRGFVAGRNWATPDYQVERALEAGTILAYLDKYCRENPLKVVFTGAASYVAALLPR